MAAPARFTSELYNQGYHALTNVIASASNSIGNQVESIQLSNRPLIEFLEVKQDRIFAAWQDLAQQLDEASKQQQNGIPGLWNLALFVVLLFVSWAFNRFTLQLFAAETLYANLYAIGAAIAAPWATDWFLTRFRARKVIDTLSLITFCSSLAMGLSFAAIRGIDMALQLNGTPAVTIDDLSTTPISSQAAASHAIWLLQLALACAALTFELVAGQNLNAFRESRRKQDPGRVWKLQKATQKKEKELRTVWQERAQVMAEARNLEAKLWADLERGFQDARKERNR